jgi:hypothetical protein
VTEGRTIGEMIAGHEARDASLRNVFMQRNVDLRESRMIECHFWTWNREDANRLGEALEQRGFEILVQRSATIAEDPKRWNLEAAIRQSIDLTMRREFIAELVRLADSHHAQYDGWGTRI